MKEAVHTGADLKAEQVTGYSVMILVDREGGDHEGRSILSATVNVQSEHPDSLGTLFFLLTMGNKKNDKRKTQTRRTQQSPRAAEMSTGADMRNIEATELITPDCQGTLRSS